MKDDTKQIEVWNKILKTALSMPNSRVDRAAFLKTQLSKRYPEEQVQAAIDTTPAKAGIPKTELKNIASKTIKFHVAGVTSLSFLAGLPGGWWMIGTIPADIAQFFGHAIQVVQKLAYIYGWPELFSENDIDDETMLEITLFIGVMFGAKAANKVVTDLAGKVSTQIANRLPKAALTKYGFYNLAKQIAKWIGIKLTKQSASRVASKAVPILGGLVSGSISYMTMKTMSTRLSRHLASLPLAG